MTESAGETIFDPQRQAELARALEQLDARPPLDRADVFAHAARTLPPPPAVARILEDGTEPEPGAS
ncbi:MAG: hypothetical protein ACXW2Y_03755 [Acidimicrobiia bacterium]